MKDVALLTFIGVCSRCITVSLELLALLCRRFTGKGMEVERFNTHNVFGVNCLSGYGGGIEGGEEVDARRGE